MLEKTQNWKESLPVKIAILLRKYYDEPRMAILTCNGMLELMVNFLIKLKCTNSKKILDNRGYSYAIKLLLLNEKGILDDKTYQVLDWFREFRNDAAHDAIFELDWNKIKNARWKTIREATDVFDLCMNIHALLWNQYKSDFTEEFVF
jgi:hypothetical protein